MSHSLPANLSPYQIPGWVDNDHNIKKILCIGLSVSIVK